MGTIFPDKRKHSQIFAAVIPIKVPVTAPPINSAGK